MPITPEDLAAKAMDLSSEARARLADLIVESLDADALGPIDRAWADEAKRRRDAFREGQAKTVPADEAIRQVRDSLKR
jgi:putative addiction module component (TIGR02574 family)